MLFAGIESYQTGLYLDFGAGTVVPAECLLGTFGEGEAAEGGDERRVQVVHCAIDLPAAKTGEVGVDVGFGGGFGVSVYCG